MEIWQQLVKLEEEGEAFGLTWPDAETILAQIESEVLEIRACLKENLCDKSTLEEEVADLLHAVTSLAWYCRFDAHALLALSCKKFAKRLQMMQKICAEEGRNNMQGESFEQLMALWDKAKQRLVKG